jgi:DNA replication protein DnaC
MPALLDKSRPLTTADQVRDLALSFRLSTVAAEVEHRFTAAGHAEALDTLLEVLLLEAQGRQERRVDRLRRTAHLPPGKTFDTLDLTRFPRPLTAQIRELARGAFLDRADNVLAFGLPGVGKTHVVTAIADALLAQGRSVRFYKTYHLVQELLAAKRDLQLPRALRKLDVFDVLVLDDIGYIQQNADEIEVLFTLLAERYERRSVMITSNLVFSQWDQIFKNPMTTAAAIDRVVHHSVILELTSSSYRTDQAKKRRRAASEGSEPAPPVVPPDSGGTGPPESGEDIES